MLYSFHAYFVTNMHESLHVQYMYICINHDLEQRFKLD